MSARQEQEIAARAVELARRAGASDAEATVIAGRELAVTVREGEIDYLREAGSRGLTLRVFDGQRAAVVSSADLSSDGLAHLTEQAVALARLAAPDPAAGLPEGPFAGGDADALELYDPELAALDTPALTALAREADAAALGHDRRIGTTDGATLKRWLGTTALANSRGFAGSYRESRCALLASALALGEGHERREDHWQASGRHLAQLGEAEAVGREAARRAVGQLGARKPATQEVPVVFAPEMARELIRLLARAASGEAQYRGFSFLIGRQGQPLASPLVTLVDDATLPGRLGSRPFDAEGVASQRTPLLSAGRFTGFLYDSYSARRAGHAGKSSGNAGRAETPAGIRLGVAPSNLVLVAGETAPEAIVAGVARGLYLTGTSGSGDNLTTGDFTRGASGRWIENGELAYPVAEINIAGRLPEMLAAIDAVGSDLAVEGQSAAPTVRVARMMVSGM
ncbi:MAG TPA: TldD/PmbA family protein [Thermomicrobiaceae bacterium]|nr:TldD/PmbA family protein [Thermomicrobiaceae bacterium]